MNKTTCEICGKIFISVGKGRRKYCPDCSNLLEKNYEEKENEKHEIKPKTDWSKIIMIQNETGLSYGKIVQKGMI